jgi:hypothetical protein
MEIEQAFKAFATHNASDNSIVRYIVQFYVRTVLNEPVTYAGAAWKCGPGLSSRKEALFIQDQP